MHVHSLCLWMCTLLHPHDTCIWGDIPRGLGTRAMILKPLAKACQTRSDGIYYLHHITKTGIRFSPFWLLVIPIHLSLRIRFHQCMKFIVVRSCVSSNSTMVAEMLNLRISLMLWERLPFSLGFGHRWILRLC